MRKIMRLPEVCALTGQSETTIWRKEKAGKCPRRRRIGPNAVGWMSDQVLEWLQELPEVQLGKGEE